MAIPANLDMCRVNLIPKHVLIAMLALTPATIRVYQASMFCANLVMLVPDAHYPDATEVECP